MSVSNTYTGEDLAKAEAILKDSFSRAILAGEKRKIHEQLARILPAGAYALCNLQRENTETRQTTARRPDRPGPSRQQRDRAQYGQHPLRRQTPFGGGTRPEQPIPLAFLSAEQRADLRRLEEEKEKQLQANTVARETRILIAQEQRRLSTAARLNLAQAELDLQKTALLRPLKNAATPEQQPLPVQTPTPAGNAAEELELLTNDKISRRMNELFNVDAMDSQ